MCILHCGEKHKRNRGFTHLRSVLADSNSDPKSAKTTYNFPLTVIK